MRSEKNLGPSSDETMRAARPVSRCRLQAVWPQQTGLLPVQDRLRRTLPERGPGDTGRQGDTRAGHAHRRLQALGHAQGHVRRRMGSRARQLLCAAGPLAPDASEAQAKAHHQLQPPFPHLQEHLPRDSPHKAQRGVGRRHNVRRTRGRMLLPAPDNGRLLPHDRGMVPFRLADGRVHPLRAPDGHRADGKGRSDGTRAPLRPGSPILLQRICRRAEEAQHHHKHDRGLQTDRQCHCRTS